MGFGQGERALELDRVLGGEDEEWIGQDPSLALDRHLSLLHRLEQGRLGAGRRPVDLVDQQDVGEDGARDEAETAALEDARAEHVSRQQVRGPLDTTETHPERSAEGAGEQRLADTRDVLDERVAVGQDRDEEQADGAFVDNDRLLHRVPDRPPEALAVERGGGAAVRLDHGLRSLEVRRSGRIVADGRPPLATAIRPPPRARNDTMSSIALTIEDDDVAVARRLLLKLQASELSDLRRAQTQLSVYGERRASMAGEPAAIKVRLALLTDLIAQIDAQLDRT